jgi:hypothetical protein
VGYQAPPRLDAFYRVGLWSAGGLDCHGHFNGNSGYTYGKQISQRVMEKNNFIAIAGEKKNAETV